MGNHFNCLVRYMAARTTEENVQNVQNEGDVDAEERRALQTSIKDLAKDPYGKGQKFFLDFFEAHPHYTNYFKAFRGKGVEELQDNRILRTHGGLVIHFVISLVEKMNTNMAGFTADIETHCKTHFKLRGITMEDYEAMFAVFCDMVIPSPHNANNVTYRAWNKVAARILGEMAKHVSSCVALKRASSTVHEHPLREHRGRYSPPPTPSPAGTASTEPSDENSPPNAEPERDDNTIDNPGNNPSENQDSNSAASSTDSGVSDSFNSDEQSDISQAFNVQDHNNNEDYVII